MNIPIKPITAVIQSEFANVAWITRDKLLKDDRFGALQML